MLTFVLSGVAATACGRADAYDRSSNDGAAVDTLVTSPTSDSRTAAVGVAPPSRANGDAPPTTAADAGVDSALLVTADRGRLLGNEKAMWVVMISDFQCPYCKMWHDSSMASLKRDYIDKGLVRMAYLHLPLPNHRHARREAEASMCAAAQDKFWEYADALFDEQPLIAKEIGRAHV